MNERRIHLVAYSLAVVSLLAWLGFGYFFLVVAQEESDHAARIAEAQDASARSYQAGRVHALVHEIADDQKLLESNVQVDPVAFADVLRAAGLAAGVQVEISNTAPEAVTGSPPQKTIPPIHAYGYTIAVHGSFVSIMRLLDLLQTLPAPSYIEQANFSHDPESATTDEWHLGAKVKVISSSNITS